MEVTREDLRIHARLLGVTGAARPPPRWGRMAPNGFLLGYSAAIALSFPLALFPCRDSLFLLLQYSYNPYGATPPAPRQP